MVDGWILFGPKLSIIYLFIIHKLSLLVFSDGYFLVDGWILFGPKLSIMYLLDIHNLSLEIGVFQKLIHRFAPLCHPTHGPFHPLGAGGGPWLTRGLARCWPLGDCALVANASGSAQPLVGHASGPLPSHGPAALAGISLGRPPPPFLGQSGLCQGLLRGKLLLRRREQPNAGPRVVHVRRVPMCVRAHRHWAGGKPLARPIAPGHVRCVGGPSRLVASGTGVRPHSHRRPHKCYLVQKAPEV